MNYNFEAIDRFATDCAKWNNIKLNGFAEDTLPLWVADMDFPTLPEITESLQKRISHPIYGYTWTATGQAASTCRWLKARHGLDVREDWLLTAPSVVAAFNMAIQCYTKEQDAILILEPEYYPIKAAILHNDRQVVVSELRLEEGHYELDFLDFESKIKEFQVKLLIFSSPHNPVGRVWTKAELKRIGSICKQHGVLVFSDEIHQDFVFPPHGFVSFLSAGEDHANFSILATSASKTFNLAGLKFSNVIIPDEVLRKLYFRQLRKCGIDSQNLLGSIATKAAYDNGEQWVDELLVKLQSNIDGFRGLLKQHLPLAKLIEPEGLYLLWVDFRAYGYSAEELNRIILETAHVWLDDGTMFGPSGDGFQRFNLATSEGVIEEAVLRIASALQAGR